MNKTIFTCKLILCCLIPCLCIAILIATTRSEAISQPAPDQVRIGPVSIEMPAGKILLVRNGSEYGCIKFTKFWTGITDQDLYASYKSCSLTGGLPKGNTEVFKGELSHSKPRGVGRLAFSFGNSWIRCGSIKLHWYGHGSVHFDPTGSGERDHGIELAPTNWSNFSDINIFDSRLKWYRFDDKRKREDIKLDEIGPP